MSVDTFMEWCLASVFAGVIAGTAYCSANVMISNGEVTHCYVQNRNNTYALYGHRDWQTDLVVQNITSAEQGILIAERMKCPLNVAEKR